MTRPSDSERTYRSTRNNNDNVGRPGNNGNDNGRVGNENNRRPGNNGNDNGRVGNDNNRRPGNNGNNGRVGNDNNRRPGNNGNNNGRGNFNRPSDRPADYGNNGSRRGNNGFGPNNRHNYDNHRYHDQFRNNYAHHRWSRPLPPPPRAWRPAPIRWYRPVISGYYRPYAGAPIIDRILGVTFGTLFDATLDYLYGAGYYIDGYADNIIYLRDVSMLNLLWQDVMFNYDGGRLVNAQFIYTNDYYDMGRYNRVYSTLSRVYGPPVSVTNDYGMVSASWYGGNKTGWVTLNLSDNNGYYYTTMSIGY